MLAVDLPFTDIGKVLAGVVIAGYGAWAARKLKRAEKQRELAAVTAQATQAAIGEPNGRGPTNRMLEQIIHKVDDLATAQAIAVIAHTGLATTVALLTAKVDTLSTTPNPLPVLLVEDPNHQP